jgi:hypothetical protein
MAQGIDYNYVRFDTSTIKFRGLLLVELLNLAEFEGFISLNVTHSFKMEVLKFLDVLSPKAQILGAPTNHTVPIVPSGAKVPFLANRLFLSSAYCVLTAGII